MQTPPPRARRSVLYVPASNEKALAKLAGLSPDAVIFDLEDSVPPAEKDAAREIVAAAAAHLVGGQREIVVRINDLDTPWAPRDIAAFAAVRPDAILIPKVQRTEDIRRARAAFTAARAASTQALWVMIETPAAVLNVAAIAAIAALPTPPVTALVLGTNDLAAQLGVPARPGRPALLPHIAHTQLAARAHGLAVLDGTFNDIDDRKALRLECQQGRDLGLDGKTVIHPSQIPVANEAFAPDTEELYADLIRSPYGMVVCAGPTGSGKTTTLYASLMAINSDEINVMTVEDPVEYTFPTINQIGIQEQAGVTFAAGLRAILRQDRVAILVGEIRDVETARIAIQAALTGHPVLSTIHATDATSALHRFLDMGIESFLLASSMLAVVGQRLMRR